MDMTLRLEESTSLGQNAEVDLLNGDFVLAEFLHEMDELDQLQAPLPRLEQDSRIDAEPTSTQADSFASSATPRDGQDKPKSAPTKRRSTSWLRRKQELQALRHESEILGARLASLRMRCAQNAYQQSSSTLTEDQETWKSVAAIARQESQTVQGENARLKFELQMHSRAFEVLQTQLVVAESRKQQLLESTVAFSNTFRVGMITSRCFNDDVFDILEKRVITRFHELDAIIYETRRSMQQDVTEQVQICRGGDHDAAAAVEFKHVRLLPFGEDATAKNIWQYIEVGGSANKADTRVARSSQDMVGLASHHRLPLGDMASVSVDVHTVIKRFAVATGMVALVESCSEWSIHHPMSVVSRSTTEEGGWVVVHEYPLQQCGDVTQRASQLKTSVKLRPREDQVDGRANPSSSLTSTMIDVVIPSFRDILTSQFQAVENCLLDSERAVSG